jgi:enoyl-CoA hydratase/carnithine racemase
MGSTYFLPQLIGTQHAARLLYTGDVISGKEAKSIGLVLDALPSGEATLDAALELAGRTCGGSHRQCTLPFQL